MVLMFEYTTLVFLIVSGSSVHAPQANFLNCRVLLNMALYNHEWERCKKKLTIEKSFLKVQPIINSKSNFYESKVFLSALPVMWHDLTAALALNTHAKFHAIGCQQTLSKLPWIRFNTILMLPIAVSFIIQARFSVFIETQFFHLIPQNMAVRFVYFWIGLS